MRSMGTINAECRTRLAGESSVSGGIFPADPSRSPASRLLQKTASPSAFDRPQSGPFPAEAGPTRASHASTDACPRGAWARSTQNMHKPPCRGKAVCQAASSQQTLRVRQQAGSYRRLHSSSAFDRAQSGPFPAEAGPTKQRARIQRHRRRPPVGPASAGKLLICF
jgi:hypothetical protein